MLERKKKNVDYSKEALTKQGYNEAQIYEITRGIQQKLPIIQIARKEYNWMQMYEIRKGLQEKVDVSQYSDPLFSAQEMREIRLGLPELPPSMTLASWLFQIRFCLSPESLPKKSTWS